MSDPLRELNAEFAENQKQRDTCGIANNGGCYAPKFEEIPLEAGLPIAACAYHYIKLNFSEEMHEEKAQEYFDVSFEELEDKTREFNEKIRAENKDSGGENHS